MMPPDPASRAPLSVGGALAAAAPAFAIVLALVAAVWLRCLDGDVTRFVDAGAELYDRLPPGLIAANLHVARDKTGFDGQQFLYQAYDPFLRGDAVPNALDSPVLRGRRLLFPLIAFTATRVAGGDAALPAAFLAISLASTLVLLVALALLVQACTERARAEGRHPPDPRLTAALLALFACSTFVLFPLYKTTSESLCMALIACSALAYARDRTATAFVLAALAVLAKETAGLWVAALGADAVWRRDARRLAASALALVPFFAWVAVLKLRFGDRTSGVQETLDWPLAGLAQQIATIARTGIDRRTCFAAVGIPTLLAICAWGVREAARRRPTPAVWLLLAATAVTLCVGKETSWDYVLNFGRQLFVVPLAALLIAFEGTTGRPAVPATLLGATGAWGAAYFGVKIAAGLP